MRKGDLHVGGEEPGALQPVPTRSASALVIRVSAASTRPCASRSSASPPAGGGATRSLERLLGTFEIADPQPDLPDFRECGCRVREEAGLELVAGAPGLCFRGDPVALPLEELGPMQPAEPGEHGERMVLRPGSDRLQPLVRTAHVAELVTRAHQRAVDLAGHERAEPSLDGEEHRLVEVREAFTGPALVDQHASGALQRLRLDIGLAEPTPEIPRSLGELAGAIELAAAVRNLGFVEEQEPVLRTFGIVLERTRGRAAAIPTRSSACP